MTELFIASVTMSVLVSAQVLAIFDFRTRIARNCIHNRCSCVRSFLLKKTGRYRFTKQSVGAFVTLNHTTALELHYVRQSKKWCLLFSFFVCFGVFLSHCRSCEEKSSGNLRNCEANCFLRRSLVLCVHVCTHL